MSADDLTPSEILVLLTLMAESRPVTNTELKRLGPDLRPASRRKLNRLELVDTDTGTRPFTHELTDAGWARCRELFGADAPPGVPPAGRTLFTFLAALRRHFDRNDLRPADLFLPADPVTEPVAAAPGPEPTPLAERVRDAYTTLAPRPGAWVGLAALRAALPEISTDVLDRELVRMYRMPDISLVPIENQKAMTDRDRAAAVVIGNQAKHVLAIEG